MFYGLKDILKTSIAMTVANTSDIHLLANAIWAFLQHGGWVMIAIFIVGQVGWFMVCERFWYYRRMHGHARRFWRKHENPDVRVVVEAIKREPQAQGVLKSLVSSLIENAALGRDAMIASAREKLAFEIPKLNRHLNTLAVLAGAAPLLGLAGTVVGIMETFRAITQFGAGNPAMMAGGIAQALMVTEAGLVVAFPLLLCHNYLQNQADQIEAECVETATRIIHAFDGMPLQEGNASWPRV
jgi:biopolymer transport protein ExbB